MTREETARRIEAALEHAPEVNLHRDSVHIETGETIRLSGRVSDVRAKRCALALARDAAGTEAVADDLLVDNGEPRGVDALRQAVVDALKREPAFAESAILEGETPPDAPGDAMAVAVDGERVHLHGRVASLGRRRLAEVLAWWVPGVADVINGLSVQPPEPDTDGELADAVRLTLEKDPSIPAGQIDVTARDGRVTLAGAVANDEERRLAVLDCWCVPGVTGVDDQLTTKTP